MTFSPFLPNGFSSCCSPNVSFPKYIPRSVLLSRRNRDVFVDLSLRISRVWLLKTGWGAGSQCWLTASLYTDGLQTAGTASPLAWVSPWAAVLLTETDFPVYRARLLHLLNEHSCRCDVTLHVELQRLSFCTSLVYIANRRTAKNMVIFSNNSLFICVT